ncbi:MAG: LD-carboxypeptidase [Bacteroidales bacterium]|nr:LD-carboxypeptidase [Bacteroidales bacterium]
MKRISLVLCFCLSVLSAFPQAMPRLKTGDTIAIVAPASAVTPEQVEPAVEYLQQRGFRVLLSPMLYEQAEGFAGTVPQRVAAFQEMLDRPGVKAILCARGGYGTVAIIDSLDFSAFRQHPKWICGYSDVTVLLSHLHTLGYPALHSVMPIGTRAWQPGNIYAASFLNALKGKMLHYKFEASPLNRTGMVTAPVVGGNLSLLYSLLGSVSDIDTDGKILFIEDVDENIYHIDRMLRALDRAGKLKNLKGVIVGGMTKITVSDYYQNHDAYSLIAEILGKYDYPVCFGFPAGHGGQNYALPMGETATLKVSEGGCSLIFRRN